MINENKILKKTLFIVAGSMIVFAIGAVGIFYTLILSFSLMGVPIDTEIRDTYANFSGMVAIGAVFAFIISQWVLCDID